jgi:hypothetical protein
MLALILALVTAVPATHAQQKPEVAEKVAGKRDKVVCKRFVETGSLVRGYRTCKTKWEWERERENLRQVNVADSCAVRGAGGSC